MLNETRTESSVVIPYRDLIVKGRDLSLFTITTYSHLTQYNHRIFAVKIGRMKNAEFNVRLLQPHSNLTEIQGFIGKLSIRRFFFAVMAAKDSLTNHVMRGTQLL